MSSKKWINFVSVLLALAGGGGVLLAQGEAMDPVLKYYCRQADAVYRSRSPWTTGVSYSFAARSYLSRFERGGEVVLKDSAVVTYYFSFGQLDSQKVTIMTSDKLGELDFSYPNLFADEYDFSFFPNDTGGRYLAIGVDADTASQLQPLGMAVIDRERHFLHRLYLYWPDREGYKRFTREMRLTDRQGGVFPEFIRDTYSKAGIFSLEHFRLDIAIDSLTVYR